MTITGQVAATGRSDAKLSKQWSLNYLISRDRGINIPAEFHSWSFDPSDGIQSSWLRDPGFQDWLATRENYFVKLSPDGDLQINGVPPGTYDLVLQLYEQPAGCLVETIGSKVVTVEVTESDLATGAKDLGTIEVPCRAGPRVGESMQVYKFLDPSGEERTIYDMKGRYVLMHVWASWCAPCLSAHARHEGHPGEPVRAANHFRGPKHRQRRRPGPTTRREKQLELVTKLPRRRLRHGPPIGHQFRADVFSHRARWTLDRFVE